MNEFSKLESLKTLLIDDNDIVRDTMQTIFAKKGCLIKAYETAEEGLQAMKEEFFDIIISDLQLPGIDGVEFFRRAMRSHRHSVKILISGYGNQRAVSEAFKIGVHAFIRKPFTLTTFLQKVIPFVEKYHDRIIRNHDSARPGADLEHPNQTRTAANKTTVPGLEKQSML